MTKIDVLILVLLGLGAFQGFRKGLINQLFSMMAFALGLYCARHFSNNFIPQLKANLGQEVSYAPQIAFGIILLITVIAVILLGKLLTTMISVVALGIPNRIAGALFGTLTMLLLIMAIIFLFKQLPSTKDYISHWKDHSVLFKYIFQVSNAIIPIFHASKI